MMLPVRKRWYHVVAWFFGLRGVCPTCLNRGGKWKDRHTPGEPLWTRCEECLGGRKVHE
jgi:hypothetical protein